MNIKPGMLFLKKKTKKITRLRSWLVKLPYVLFRLEPVIPISLAIKLTYYMRMEKKLNLNDPKDFNEKLQWLKVYYRDPLYVQCADKYCVREYVAEQGFEDTLNELYRVYEKAEDINFGELPDRFALKCNHANATNVICDNKNTVDEAETKKMFRKWLKRKNGYFGGEFHYNYIKPLILAEKNLATENGVLPIDYKIFCFNGEPSYIAIYADRNRDTLATKRIFYDFEWNVMDFVDSQDKIDPSRFKRPINLEQMYLIAKKLSAPFPFVRVDLYEDEGKIIFGELTFFPTGGFGKGYTQECYNEFGDLITLPPKSKNKSWV